MPRMTAPAAAATTGPAPAIVTAAPVAPMPGSTFQVPGAPPPRIASSDPDTFVSTGLANNFNGRVVSGSLLPRKYKTGKKANTYSLTWELMIQADDHSIGKDGLVVEYLKIDQLSQWVPSRVDPQWNGSEWIYTPAGGTLDLYMKLHNGEAGFPVANGQPGETAILPPDDWRGYFAIPGAQNNRDSFMKGTKFDQFQNELKRLEYKKKAPHINWGDFRQFLVGVYGKWVRIPFTFSGGAPPPVEAGQEDRGSIDTLCLAEILDLGPISGAGGPVQVAVPAMSATVPISAPAAAMQQQVAAFMQPVAAVQTPAAVPVPAPAAVLAAVQQVAPSSQRNDPAAISAAADQIITELVMQRGAAGITKSELGVPILEGLTAMGLDGATGLRMVNDPDWVMGDDRHFAWVPEVATAFPLPT